MARSAGGSMSSAFLLLLVACSLPQTSANCNKCSAQEVCHSHRLCTGPNPSFCDPFFGDCGPPTPVPTAAPTHAPTPAPPPTPAPTRTPTGVPTPAPPPTPTPSASNETSTDTQVPVATGCGQCPEGEECQHSETCLSSGEFCDDFFNECGLSKPADWKPHKVDRTLILLVLAFGVVGLMMVWFFSKRQEGDFWLVLRACQLSAFYSLSSMMFTVGSQMMLSSMGIDPSILGDFFTNTAFQFVLLLCGIGTLGAAGLLVTSCFDPMLVVLVVAIYMAAAGFFAFTMCVVIFSAIALLFFCLMNLAVSRLAKWWREHPIDDKQDEESGQESASEPASGKMCAICAVVASIIPCFVGAVVNFVFQTVLITFAVGGVQFARKFSSHGANVVGSSSAAVIGERIFVFYGDVAARFEDMILMPAWTTQFVSIAADVSSFLNTASEEATIFGIGYTNIWTPDVLAGYISVGVMEIFVICAVLGVVLSDVLLVLAPREGMGMLTKQVENLVARVLLYLLQAGVSASNAFILVLVGVTALDRPVKTKSQNFFSENSQGFGVGMTAFYVLLVICFAMRFLVKLWSGNDSGLQQFSTELLLSYKIPIKTTEQNESQCCAFIPAFFGIWTQNAMQTFEIRERKQTFRLGQDEVIIATVNALSFPFYLVPGGCTVAKLSEYLNQYPVYIAGRQNGRSFSFTSLFLTVTYLAEYIIVLLVAKELLNEIEVGIAQHHEIKEEARLEEGESEAVALVQVLFALAALRQLVLTLKGIFHLQSPQVGSGEVHTASVQASGRIVSASSSASVSSEPTLSCPTDCSTAEDVAVDI